MVLWTLDRLFLEEKDFYFLDTGYFLPALFLLLRRELLLSQGNPCHHWGQSSHSDSIHGWQRASGHGFCSGHKPHGTDLWKNFPTGLLASSVSSFNSAVTVLKPHIIMSRLQRFLMAYSWNHNAVAFMDGRICCLFHHELWPRDTPQVTHSGLNTERRLMLSEPISRSSASRKASP